MSGSGAAHLIEKDQIGFEGRKIRLLLFWELHQQQKERRQYAPASAAT
jgi:hypothetical protein